MNLLIFTITGLFLLLLFRVLNRITKAFIRKRQLRGMLLRILPVVELVAWVAFSFWGVLVLFGQHQYYDLIVVLLAVLVIFGLAWFVFRDFLAGVLLKSEKALHPGQVIKTPIVEGKIKSMGFRNIELVNEAGETVNIPYSRLSDQLFIIPPDNEDSLPHQVKIPLVPKQASEQTKEKVYKHLMGMPWVISPAPGVQIIKHNDGHHIMHVTFYTYMRTHALIVEEKIRTLLKEDAGVQ